LILFSTERATWPTKFLDLSKNLSISLINPPIPIYDVKRELLRYASELQVKLGRKVDYNEAIKHLLKEKTRNPAQLNIACKPIEGVEEARRMLYEERKLDKREP